jgi:hypothetical protein
MEEDKHNYGKILQLIQLVVIAAGVAGFFVDIGKRSSMLDKNADDLRTKDHRSGFGQSPDSSCFY